MIIPQSCDVVVIGGGPAGSMSATFLSQKGYHVVLLEKLKHPRPHIGENLIPHFWKYTDLAQVSEQIANEGFVQKAGGTVMWQGVIRQMAFKDFGYSRPAFHVERDRFDHILLENSKTQGAEVFEQVAVLNVDLRGETEQQIVTYRNLNDKSIGNISCRFIVDASGQNAVIGKQLGLRVVDQGFRYMSLWGYFNNAKYVAEDGQVYPHQHLFQLRPNTFMTSIPETGDAGWSWHIPLRENTSVGLILPLEFMKTAKSESESWESYYLRKCYEIPILNQLLENAEFCPGSFAKIQDYSYRSTQLAGSGFFLIGDAGSFIDPIFSIGMIMGMYGAYISTWAIDRSLKKPNSVKENQVLFSSQLQGRLETSRSLALPNYQLGEVVSQKAKITAQFEPSLEQELMNVVAQITTRSDNFLSLMNKSTDKKINSDKLKVLEKISF
ncbi:NAD(P)/FAD-dependent oxidoreductase [Geminocystis sp. GBBB08]|uniref:NAD(P)/FAD-dependent oxidoreductase n=1 Tax=Geminocystis sp. GBBB08 TaxID=2604140 RepID=UPI0027E22BD1|nr:NAD(P)/FAD-dependent oxidoreductase [Geminocystis sp. GBBB08]MBL1209293.1 NAD(P)/FAD-dependent oxidoreductase [Geminocystis sp. GBBB08]